MYINSNTIVSISDANQNFSKIARLVDKYGSAVILKNNSPKYLLINFNDADNNQFISDDHLAELSQKFITKNKAVYEELAK